MSSTSNIQNLLVNVFRPVYTYSNGTYTPKLNISNVDTVSARTLEVTTFGFGDSNGNIYIGSNSGGTSNNSANVGIGVSAATNAISTSNSVFIGYGAGLGASNSSNNIVVGYNASGAGNNNIYIGSNDGGGASSSNNIYIGNGLSNTGSVTNKFQLGFPGSILMTGDFSNKQLGINTAPSYTLDVCGDFRVTERYGTFILGHDTSLNLTTDIQSTNPGSKALLNVVGDISAQVIYGTVAGTLATPSIALGNGTAAAPSHSFSNATNYGMFYANTFGPNRVGLAAFGNEIVSISKDGNVGIATSTPTSTLDVCGNVNISSNVYLNDGSAGLPSYSFKNDASTGFYYSGTNQVSFVNRNNTRITFSNTDISSTSGTLYFSNVTYGGNLSSTTGGMVISNNGLSNTGTITSSNFVGTTTTSTNILSSGYLRNALTPSQWDISGGNMRLSSNLNVGTITVLGDVSSSGTFYGNYVATSITSSNLVVPGYIRNDTSGSLLDISGGNIKSQRLIDASGITVSNYIRNNTAASLWDISGGNMRLTQLLDGSSITVSNYIRNNTAGSLWDISGGNMRLTQRFDGSGITVSNYIRNALTPSTLDISGGNISNSATTTSSNFIGTASASNQIGGVTLSNSNAIVGGWLRNALTPTTLDISSGSMALSSKLNVGSIASSTYTLDITTPVNPGMALRSTQPAAMRFIGGGSADSNSMAIFHTTNDQGIVTSNTSPFNFYMSNVKLLTILSNGFLGLATSNPGYTLDVNGTTNTTNILSSGYLRNALTPSLWDISGGSMRLTQRFDGSGITFNTYFRNALTPSTLDISGGNISNSGTTTSSNFIGTASASNQIGGVTLSNNNISYSGTITGSTANTSNSIGGVILSNTSVGIGATPSNMLDIQKIGTNVTADLRIFAGSGGTASSTNVSKLIYTVRGAGGGDTSTTFQKDYNSGGNNYGVSILDNNSSNYVRFDTTNRRIGVGTLAPIVPLDISNNAGTTTFRCLGANNSFVQISNQSGYGHIQMNGYFYLYSNSSSNPVLSNQIVQFSSESGAKHFIRNSFLGLGTVDALYPLDVSCAPTTAAVNMSTWPRTPSNNMLLVKGAAATTRTGNTIRFNAATQSMNSNILEFSADGTNGNYLKPLKNGIFSIQVAGVVAVNNNYIWIDVSTNDNSNIAYNTAGNPVIAFYQGPFTGVAMNFTGYLASNVFYKIRASGDIASNTIWNLCASLLSEVSGTNTWPL